MGGEDRMTRRVPWTTSGLAVGLALWNAACVRGPHGAGPGTVPKVEDHCRASAAETPLAGFLPAGQTGDLLRAYFAAANGQSEEAYGRALGDLRKQTAAVEKALAAAYAAAATDSLARWNLIQAAAAIEDPSMIRLLRRPLGEPIVPVDDKEPHSPAMLARRREVAVRLRAIDGLAALAPGHPEATDALREALAYPDVAVKKMAAFHLVRLAGGDRARVEEIARLLSTQDRWMLSVQARDIARSPELNARAPHVSRPREAAPTPRTDDVGGKR
jgi:hypothetical protein